MKKIKFECWNVAFRTHRENIKNNTAEFTIIKNPHFYWAADPFVFFYEDNYYVFAELYNRLTFKGDIRYCKISKEGKVLSRWKKALNVGYHLSFPYIYKKDNNIFMMPEASKGRELSIYKADTFPQKWSLYKKLVQGKKYADSIFLGNDIFTYDNYSRPRRAILLKQVNGEWKENNVIDDPEIMLRPGGKAFNYEGNKVIPFQDSHTGEYGGSLHFATIDLDNKKTKDLFTLTPNDITLKKTLRNKIIGIHTFNYDNELEVIDVKTNAFNFFSFIGYITIRLFRK